MRRYFHDLSQHIYVGCELQVKVLFIASAFPRAAGDVITPWLVEMIHRLQQRGIVVEVLAPAYRGQGNQVVHDIQVHRFRYGPARWETLTHDQTAPDRIRERPLFLALVPGYMLCGSFAAARLVRSGAFDLVHAFWPVPHGLMGIVAKRFGRVALVCTFFGVELTWIDAQLPFLRPILRMIVRASDAVTAISSYTAERLRQVVPGTRVTIVPFGVAVRAPPVQVERGRPARIEGFELLFVGRLVERKGVHVLLEALALLRDSHPVFARVVGDGPERAALESRAAALGVEDRVLFEGAIPREQLEQRFASCDAVVLPAVKDAKGDTEGLGVVLLEAFSYAKPVIASSAGGIVDIVEPDVSGVLVPPGDADALAKAITACIADPVRTAAMGVAGRARLEREFSWPVIVERLTDVYQQVIRRPLRQSAASRAADQHRSATK